MMLQHMKMRVAQHPDSNAENGKEESKNGIKPVNSDCNFAELLLSLKQSTSTDTNLTYDSVSPDEKSVNITPQLSPKHFNVNHNMYNAASSNNSNMNSGLLPHGLPPYPSAFPFMGGMMPGMMPGMLPPPVNNPGMNQFAGFGPSESSSSSSAAKRLKTDMCFQAGSYDSFDSGVSRSANSSTGPVETQNKFKMYRGKYKCSHCGAPKTNHVCPVLEQSVLVCSTGTQMEPVQFTVIANTLIFKERTVTVSGRKQI